MAEIVEECNACKGTGLYVGFAERKGEAVICLVCKGMGWKIHEYKPFERRRPRKGIETVKYSRGRFIFSGVGGAGESMTYKEFLKKVPEQ